MYIHTQRKVWYPLNHSSIFKSVLSVPPFSFWHAITWLNLSCDCYKTWWFEQKSPEIIYKCPKLKVFKIFFNHGMSLKDIFIICHVILSTSVSSKVKNLWEWWKNQKCTKYSYQIIKGKCQIFWENPVSRQMRVSSQTLL